MRLILLLLVAGVAAAWPAAAAVPPFTQQSLVLAAAAATSVNLAATSSASPLTSLPGWTAVAGAQPAVGARTLAYVPAWTSAIEVARVDGRRGKTIYPSDASWPAVSADGKLVAFMRGHNEVWVMRRDGSNAHFVAHGTSPSFSPDGRRLAIGGAQTTPFRYELDVVDLDGSNRHAVATDAAPYPHPSWSPNGKQIAFVGYTRMQMDFTSILRVNSDGSGEKGVRIYGEDPAWSPNGSWIAYTSNGDRSKPTQLHLVRPDGTRDHRIARFAKRGATSGAWVGSKRVVFTTLAPDEAGIGPADDGRLWQVDTSGRGLRPLGCHVRPRSSRTADSSASLPMIDLARATLLERCSECVRGRLPLPEALRDELGSLLLAPAVQHLEV